MKNVFIVFMFLITFKSSSQYSKKIRFEQFVECFYLKNTSEPILIYKNYNAKLIAKLHPLNESYCWYKFTISESKNGWLKIENIKVLPGCDDNEIANNLDIFKDKWVLAKNMRINLPDVTKESGVKMNIYSNPDKSSNIVFTAAEFLSTELIEVNGSWAMVKFEKNGQIYSGWLEKKYQCSSPWTTCPVYD